MSSLSLYGFFSCMFPFQVTAILEDSFARRYQYTEEQEHQQAGQNSAQPQEGDWVSVQEQEVQELQNDGHPGQDDQ